MVFTASDFPVELLDRYKLIGLIGRGGMGSVYRALDLNLRKDVAIKTLQKSVGDRKLLMKFQKEAQTIARLEHPNVVRVIDFSITKSGDAYMVMDYVNGKALSYFLTEERATELGVILNVMRQICEGVDHAHRHGVVHRDLKPSNVMIEETESGHTVVRIIDFGIAQLVLPEERGGIDTVSGRIFGSPAYMSPESSRGEGDERSDIYALGCLLFECLTGQQAFDADTAMEMVRKHANDEAPRLVSLTGEDTEAWNLLQAVVDKCLEKEPQNRYQSVLELVQALNSVSDTIPSTTSASKVVVPDTPAVAYRLSGSAWRAFSNRRSLSVMILVTMSVAIGLACIRFTIEGEKKRRKLDDIAKLASSRDSREVDEYGPRLGAITTTIDKVISGSNRTFTDDDVFAGRVKDETGHLELAQSGVTDRGLAELVRQGIDPVLLNVSWTRVTDEGFKAIAQMSRLKILKADGLPLTDKGISYIQHSNLHLLSLRDACFTDKGLEMLSKMPELKTARLAACKNITTRGVERLKSLKTLTNLYLENTNVRVSALRGMKSLSSIALRGLPCSDEDLKNIVNDSKEIRSIDLTSTDITVKGLETLLQAPKLTWLGLYDCAVKESDVKQFRKTFRKRYDHNIVCEIELPYQGLRGAVPPDEY